MSGSAARATSSARLEWQIVVLLIQRLRERVERLWGFPAGFGGPFRCSRTHWSGSASRTQHDQLARDNLGDVARLFFAIFPRAILDPALDVDLVALLEVLLRDIGQAAPGSLVIPADDPMPLRLFLLFPAGPRPLAARRHGQSRHAGSVVRAAHLGICTQVPDQDDLIETAAHNNLRRFLRVGPKGAQHYINRKSFCQSKIRHLYRSYASSL